MLYLFDRLGALQTVLAEHESIVTTERYAEHSEWSGKFPSASFTALSSAYFAIVEDEPEVYLVEKLELVTEGARMYATASGRSASALLHMRTILGAKSWVARTAGYMIADMMAALTGARALPLTFGTGTAVGTTFDLQRSWGDMGEAALECLQAKGLGMRTRLDGAAVKLDVYAANNVDTVNGERYGNGTGSKHARALGEWRNFAYVLGEGEGAARRQVTVDQVGTNPRRELYVDARDVSSKVDISIAATVSAANDIFTATAHPFVNGNGIQLSDLTGGAPMATGTTYYVVNATADTFALSVTPGGAAFDITTDGTATIGQVTLTTAQYDALLSARGAAKLAETRRIEYAEAQVTSALRAGDVIWYDSTLWSASYMVTEAVTTREGGTVTHSATLGEPPATLKKTFRRYF